MLLNDNFETREEPIKPEPPVISIVFFISYLLKVYIRRYLNNIYIKNIFYKKMLSNFLSLFLFYFFRIVFLSKFKKKIIILHSTNNFNYAENTKYLFEYLIKKNIKCYWVTENEKIKNYLESKNFKFISKTNFIKYIYISLKAKLIISPAAKYHNPFNILSFDKETIKINVDHGTGIKMY